MTTMTMTTTTTSAMPVVAMPTNNKSWTDYLVAITVSVHGKSFVKKNKVAKETVSKQHQAAVDRFTLSAKLLESSQKNAVINAGVATRKLKNHYGTPMGRDLVISVTEVADFKAKLDAAIQRHHDAKQAFINDLEKLKAADKAMGTGLGDLYDEKNYPTAKEIDEAFSIEWRFDPVTNKTISGLPIEIANILSANNKADENAFQYHLLNKLMMGTDPETNGMKGNGLGFIIESLGKLANGEQKTIKQNSFDNIREVVRIVRNLNVVGNPDITKVCDTLDNLFKVDAENVRGDDATRDDIIDKAEATIDDIESIMEGLM